MRELVFSRTQTLAAALVAFTCSLLATGAYAQSQGVTVVPWDGTSFDDLNPDGSQNIAGIAAVTTKFYQSNPDAFDFIVIATDFPFVPEFENEVAIYTGLRNDVSGIGMELFDNGSLLGSAQRLQGVIKFPEIQVYAGANHRAALKTLAHEISHRFSFRMQFRDSAGVVRSDLVGRNDAHWSAFADSGGSFLYGARWRDNGDGTWTSAAFEERYSDVELYAMGLLSPDEVAPITLLEPAAGTTLTADDLPTVGTTISAIPRAVTIADIRAAMGPRAPISGQTAFRAAFVLLSHDATPNLTALTEIERLRADFEQEFFFLTRGRATLETTITRAPPTPVPPSNAVAAAASYLRSRADIDGSFADTAETSVRDTAEVVAAMSLVAGEYASVSAALPLLMNACMSGVSTLDRAYAHGGLLRSGLPEALASTCVASWPAPVESFTNADGYGIGPGYTSDPATTVALFDAVIFLLGPTAIDDDLLVGLIPVVANGATRSAGLATLLNVAKDRGAAVVPVAQALEARQNPDGGFGEPQSNILDTALALSALAGRGALQTIARARAYLLARQASDGSFDRSIYVTAAALRALVVVDRSDVRVVSAVVSPGLVSEGDTVEVTALVENGGLIPTAPTTVRLFDDTGAVRGGADGFLPPLSPGERASVSLRASTAGFAGNRALIVVADPDAAIPDANRENNRFAVPVTIVPGSATPDLAVLSFEVSPRTIFAVPQPIDGTVRVANRGKQPAFGVLNVRSASGALVFNAALSLPALGETTIEFSFATTTDFAFTATAELDLPGLDPTPTNNSRSVLLPVTQRANFIAQNVVAPGPFAVGTTCPSGKPA